MHRFIALRELRSNAGETIFPGDFVPELEAAPYNIQISNVNQCMVFDLERKIQIDEYERLTLRAQAALVANVELVKGCSIFDLGKVPVVDDENPATTIDPPAEQPETEIQEPEPEQLQAAAEDPPKPSGRGGRKKKDQ